MSEKYILSIDQGTTGTTVLLVDKNAEVFAKSYREIKQYYPQPAWVEHDAEEIWESVEFCIADLLSKNNLDWNDIDSIGITNQRETTVLWDSKTAKPLHKAIVWQCRRTVNICDKLRSSSQGKIIKEKTGLLVDAYFSATKLQWLLDTYDPDRKLAISGEIKFGTIDTWLMYKLSDGRFHLTDHTNASRTMLYNIQTNDWDTELLEIFNIPRKILPDIKNSSEFYFNAGPDKNIPVCGVAGDQQAALYGHGAWDSGTIKNTYGTGCFMMINTGCKRIQSDNGLLTTIACDENGAPVYALEGSVFIAGAVIQYLRDELELIDTAAESEKIAQELDNNGGVYFVPAFTGLGAPWWDGNARGAISGLTRGSSKKHIVRAALESIAYQTADIFSLMLKESGLDPKEIKVDGGASENKFLMQFQSDLLSITIEKNSKTELTALGAAGLAGIYNHFWGSPEKFRQLNLKSVAYYPRKEYNSPMKKYQKEWKEAVKKVLC